MLLLCFYLQNEMLKMEKVLITGAAGLVGSECCQVFAEKGYRVIGVDNYMRGTFFGEDGNTQLTIKEVMGKFDIELHEIKVFQQSGVAGQRITELDEYLFTFVGRVISRH